MNILIFKKFIFNKKIINYLIKLYFIEPKEKMLSKSYSIFLIN